MRDDGVFARPGDDAAALSDGERRIPGASSAAAALQAARDGAFGDLDGMSRLGFTTRRSHLRSVS